MRRRYFCLAWFLFHFALILGISAQQTFWILARGYTGLPHSFDSYWRKAAELTTAALGLDLSLSNPLRESLTAYLHGAGIEGGYGYFAPNVPSSYKLVFELHYLDGHVEYDLPHVRGPATGLRLVSLLDQIGRTQYEPLREVMLKMLAYSAWRQHPGALTVRAVFGYVDVPTIDELREGKTETYTFLYAYDFTFPATPAEPSP
ncbi:MAG: hypothetical protein ABR514_09500 [Chthoniobacterales bacterium]